LESFISEFPLLPTTDHWKELQASISHLSYRGDTVGTPFIPPVFSIEKRGKQVTNASVDSLGFSRVLGILIRSACAKMKAL
jgi:hypothetical protein